MSDQQRYIDVVFDGPPGPVPGRFVEVEDENGAGIRVGEWINRAGGMWALRIPIRAALTDPAEDVTPRIRTMLQRRRDEMHASYVRRDGTYADADIAEEIAELDLLIACVSADVDTDG